MSINHKLATNRSNPRSMKNVRGLSETEGSDISAQDFSKKTFDQWNKTPKDLRQWTSIMLQGKTNIKYKKLLESSKHETKKQ